jgi:hypothetical protein
MRDACMMPGQRRGGLTHVKSLGDCRWRREKREMLGRAREDAPVGV